MNKGFTLIELAIVVLIVGLLIGGIVGAQSLIESAKIRSVITDLNSFHTAIKAFKLEYDALPGDFAEAYDYWGADCAVDEDSCNGDGDKAIEYRNKEDYYVWRHLYLAQIYPKFYEVGGRDIGINFPETPYNNSGYWVISGLNSNLISPYGITRAVEYLVQIGGNINGEYNYLTKASITPHTAYILDKKTDDGKPGTGSTMAKKGAWLGNVCIENPDSSSLASYMLSDTEVTCRIFFLY